MCLFCAYCVISDSFACRYINLMDFTKLLAVFYLTLLTAVRMLMLNV